MKNTKKPKTDEKDKQIEELKSGWQRCQADFENFRRRVEKEKADWAKESKIDVIVKLLPSIDNLSRAIAHAPKNSADQRWIDGVAMVIKQISESLHELGIEKIAPKVGDPLNPYLEEAISSEESKTIADGCISKVELDGYKIGETVIRPARVVTSVCKK